MQNERVDSEWVVTLAAGAALLVGVAGSMARAARRGASWQAQVEARWREVAERIGAKLEVAPSGKLSPRRLTITRAAADVIANVDVNVPVDPGAPSHTRARARFALGRGPIFRMWPRGVADLPGMERDVLANHALARRVRVETDQPAATAALFSDEASSNAVSFARPIALRSDGGAIELLWDGVETDGAVLSSALALVAEMAASGTIVLRELADIDGAEYVSIPDGGPFVRVRRADAEVELVAEPGREGPTYGARASAGRALPAFSVEIAADGTVSGDIPSGVIDPESAPPLARVGPATLKLEGEQASIRWIEAPTRDRADAGVRLLLSIASSRGRHGAFR